MKITDVVIVADCSGSMGYLQTKQQDAIWNVIQGEYRLGSRSARMLLGLPETGRIRVKPVETTAPFEVFVQSASVNRKLVEGQKLLTVG